MTKADLIKLIAFETGNDTDQVSVIVESFFSNVKGQLAKNEAIFIRGFGSFQNVKRAKKMGRIIATNKPILIPEHYCPTYKPSPELKALIAKSVKVV